MALMSLNVLTTIWIFLSDVLSNYHNINNVYPQKHQSKLDEPHNRLKKEIFS